jgi:hypothetical protein
MKNRLTVNLEKFPFYLFLLLHIGCLFEKNVKKMYSRWELACEKYDLFMKAIYRGSENSETNRKNNIFLHAMKLLKMNYVIDVYSEWI